MKVVDGNEDSVDFKFNENAMCYTSPLPKRKRLEKGRVDAQRHIRFGKLQE